MGRQANKRRQRKNKAREDTPPPPPPEPPKTPWVRSPWKTGMVGAAALVGLALAQIAWQSLRRTPPASAPLSRTVRVSHLDEREPNNTAAAAQSIPSLPVELRGNLTAGDRDFYRWTITEPDGHLLDVRVDGLPGTRLAVQRADGTTLAQSVSPARIGALGVVKGELLLVVDGAAGAYRLIASQSPWVKGLDWEPDDDGDHAQGMEKLEASDKEISRYRAQGWWSRPDDVDCYTLPLSVPAAGAVARLELKPPKGVQPELWVLDVGDPAAKVPRKELVRATARAAGQSAIVPALGERSWEPAYVICTRAHAGERFDERYLLEARTFTPEGPFEFEPNGTLETASALPRDVALRGYLTDADVDWYRISAGAKGLLHVSVSGVPGVTAEVVLHDERGRELARATGGAGKSVEVEHLLATFVEVRAVAGGNVTDKYQISTSIK